MRFKRLIATGVVSIFVMSGLLLKTGCSIGGDFLGLEDYQRDLLVVLKPRTL